MIMYFKTSAAVLIGTLRVTLYPVIGKKTVDYILWLFFFQVFPENRASCFVRVISPETFELSGIDGKPPD